MKGILLKELYCVLGYFKLYLVLIPFFVLLSLVSPESSAIIFFPCMLSGMIGVSLLATDEKEKWNIYAASLPYSRAQIVSGKYLIGLIMVSFTLLIWAAAKSIMMTVNGAFDISVLLNQVSMLVMFALIPGAFLLPFAYKFGVEKGRIMYYVVIGVACAIPPISGELGNGILNDSFQYTSLIILGAALVIYAVSWLISAKIYQGKEI